MGSNKGSWSVMEQNKKLKKSNLVWRQVSSKSSSCEGWFSAYYHFCQIQFCLENCECWFEEIKDCWLNNVIDYLFLLIIYFPAILSIYFLSKWSSDVLVFLLVLWPESSAIEDVLPDSKNSSQDQELHDAMVSEASTIEKYVDRTDSEVVLATTSSASASMGKAFCAENETVSSEKHSISVEVCWTWTFVFFYLVLVL